MNKIKKKFYELSYYLKHKPHRIDKAILKLETILFRQWYKHFGSKKYNCIRATILWNTRTKFLNNLRDRNGRVASLVWQR